MIVKKDKVWIIWMTSDEKTPGFASLLSGNMITIAKNLHNHDLSSFSDNAGNASTSRTV